jgi:hypothetical protein
LDLGTPTLVGSTLLNNGTVTVTAAGSDIWGSTDQGQFVYQTWTGDGMITARVVDLTNTNASAKAGVMFRESLAADARNAFTEVTPTKGAQFQVRLNTGSTTSAPAIVGGRAAPQWVRLVRKSGVYTSSVSTDGLTWTQLATPTSVTMTASPIYVGLAVTSHNANSRATAHFDNVTVIGPPAPPTQLAATVGSGQVTLSWMPSSSANTYAVKRATVSGGPYTTLASGLTANTYVDSTVSSGSTYYYVVTGTNALNESSNSAEASASLYIAQEVWRLSYFGTVANSGIAADTADPDGDGMTNLQEFQAGTDPVNSASVFRVSQMAAQGTDYVIGFSTVAGHVYTIQRSTDLSFNGWTTVADNLSATGSSLRWTDVGAVSTYKRVFYRVRLKQ